MGYVKMSRVSMIIDGENGWEGLTARLAAILQPRDVLTLQGDLGAGKTAFTRILIHTLAGDTEVEVPSPTFTLVQTYDLAQFSLWHFDLYRLPEKEIDILELGWDDVRRDGVAVVEWPERLGSLLPQNRLEIIIRFVKDSDNKREVELVPHGDWIPRFKEI